MVNIESKHSYRSFDGRSRGYFDWLVAVFAPSNYSLILSTLFRTWQPANLQAPVLSKAHTYFRYLWDWNGEATEILSRVTDDTGYIQPTLAQLVKARGTNIGGYHMNPITAWQIKNDGSVFFKPE